METIILPMTISILFHTALKRITNIGIEKYRCKEWAEMKWNQNKTNQHILKPEMQKDKRKEKLLFKKKLTKKAHYWNSQCEHFGYTSGPINEK